MEGKEIQDMLNLNQFIINSNYYHSLSFTLSTISNNNSKQQDFIH